jgi:tRNA 2-thiouridine synthesizing protein A
VSGEPRLVDARGLLCPWPVIRLARAAREMGGAGAVRILADDPIAPREIEQLCEERGWGFAPDPENIAAFDVLVR